MLFKTACALGIAVLLAGSAAHAQYRPAVIDVNNEFGIAAQEFLQSYSEHYQGATPDSEHGAIQGLEVKATGMFDLYGVSHLYAGIRFQYDHGGIQYDGASLFTGAPLNTTTHYTIDDVGVELGKGFLLTDRVLITPLVEAGWHSWERALSREQVEDYSHEYVGAGLRGDLAITERLVLTSKVAIATTIDPSMTATPLAGFLPRMTYSLGMAPIYQADFGADYKFFAFHAPLHIYGGAEVTHFSYGQSAVNQYGFLEPDSITNEITFHLGLAVGL
jgi:hypothetical protein